MEEQEEKELEELKKYVNHLTKEGLLMLFRLWSKKESEDEIKRQNGQ